MLDGVLCSASFAELSLIAGSRELIEKAVQLTLGCLQFATNEYDAGCSSEALDILLDTWASMGGRVPYHANSSSWPGKWRRAALHA